MKAHDVSSCRQRRTWAILSAALVALPGPVAPATIVVDDSCALIDAITAANTDAAVGGCPAGNGPDEIRLTKDVTLTTPLSGDNGLPIVNSEITLEGGSHVVERDPAAVDFIRIFEVAVAGDLVLRNTTVSGGGATDIDYTLYGKGAAIFNEGSVSVIDSRFEGNRGGYGGAIYNHGSLTVIDSTFTGGRSIAGQGGAVYNSSFGYSLLIGSTFQDNLAWYAGGAVASGGVLIVDESLFAGNVAQRGGGLYSAPFGSTYAAITNSTFSGNQSSAISALQGDVDTTLVTNSTFSGNGDSSDDVTVWGAKLRNSVLADSVGDHCGEIVDEGGNLADDDTCGAAGVLTGLDTVLADNGGPTLTHALLEGSSAIDAAGACGLETDQRRFGRTDGACDSGAFEFGASGFFVALSGSCPGQVTVRAVTPEPHQRVMLFAGADGGVTVLDRGRCAGTELQLGGARLWRRLMTGPDGEVTFERALESPWCERRVQGLSTDCGVTSPVGFP